MASTSYSAVSVTTTPTTIMAANNGRRTFILHNNGGNIVYIGLDSSVTSSTGIGIMPQDKFEQNGVNIWMGAIWGVTSSGSSDVRYWDIGG